MNYRRLGRTDLMVSELCLGTMTFGEQNTEAEGHAQMDYAVERGINFFDTAELYPIPPKAETQGATERIIGSWFKARGNRDKIILATKVVGRTDMDWFRDGRRKGELNREQIEEAVNKSLKRLQTDYIDLYQLHWPSRNVPIFGANQFDPRKERNGVPIEDTLAVLGELIKEGKIRHIGVSNESPWGVCEYIKQAEMKGLPRIATIQNLYNLTARAFESTLLDEVCFREEVSLLAYSPLAFGQQIGRAS